MTKNKRLIVGITLFLLSLAIFVTGLVLLINRPQTSDVSVAELSQIDAVSPMNLNLGPVVPFGNTTTATFNFIAPKSQANSTMELCYVDTMFGTGGGASATRHPITVLSGSITTPKGTAQHKRILNPIRGAGNQSVIIEFITGPATGPGVATGDRVTGSFTYKAGPGTVWSETPTVKVSCIVVGPDGEGTGMGESAWLKISWLNPNPTTPPAVAPPPASVTPPQAVAPQPQSPTTTSSAQTSPPAVSEEDPRAVSEFGEIVFASAIDLTTADLANLNNQITIGRCTVGIDESLSGLRQSSGRITLKGVKLANDRPAVWKDGNTNFSNEITNVIYSATTETLSFEVTDITTYQLGSGLELVDVSKNGDKLVVKGKVNDLTSKVTLENVLTETIVNDIEVSLSGEFTVEVSMSEVGPVVVAESCSGRKDRQQIFAEFGPNNTAMILVICGLVGMILGAGFVIYERKRKHKATNTA